MKSLISNFLPKLVFLALKKLVTLSTTREKNFFSNFEHYDLTIGMKFECEILYAYTNTSQVLDPTVTYLKFCQKLKIFTSHQKRVVFARFESFWQFGGQFTLGVKRPSKPEGLDSKRIFSIALTVLNFSLIF